MQLFPLTNTTSVGKTCSKLLGKLLYRPFRNLSKFSKNTNLDKPPLLPKYIQARGRIIKMLVKLQCSAPCISSYNMKAAMCQQCCKSGSSKIYKFIVGRLYVLLRREHCCQRMATYNMEQPIRERVTNYSKSLFVVFHS